MAKDSIMKLFHQLKISQKLTHKFSRRTQQETNSKQFLTKAKIRNKVNNLLTFHRKVPTLFVTIYNKALHLSTENTSSICNRNNSRDKDNRHLENNHEHSTLLLQDISNNSIIMTI